MMTARLVGSVYDDLLDDEKERYWPGGKAGPGDISLLAVLSI
jgi:hypothetical protein